MLTFARKYLELGLNVIPADGKIPLVKWQDYQRRKVTQQEIVAWWRKYPSANIAMVAGSISNSIIVVDADTREAIRSLKEKGIPRTWVTKTRRGYHYFFKTDKPVRSMKINDGIDLKGEGSIVILPPSRHPEGGTYRWYTPPWQTPLAELPGWLLEMETEKPSLSRSEIAKLLCGVKQGTRNVSLTRLVGLLARVHFNPEDIMEIAMEWNRLNNPPLEEKEVLRTVKSILSREKQIRRRIPEYIRKLSPLFQGIDIPQEIAGRITLSDLLYNLGGNNEHEA